MLYQWLEDSLTSGEKANEDLYLLKIDSEEIEDPNKSLPAVSGGEDQPKRTKYSPDDTGDFKGLESQNNTQGSPDSPTSCTLPSTSASPVQGIAETPTTSPQSEVSLTDSYTDKFFLVFRKLTILEAVCVFCSLSRNVVAIGMFLFDLLLIYSPHQSINHPT